MDNSYAIKWLLAACLLWLLPLQSFGFQPMQRVRGWVRDAHTLQPLGSAAIQLRNDQHSAFSESDSSGLFLFEQVPSGRYQLEVQLLGYERLCLPEVMVGGGKEVVLELDLQTHADTLQEVVLHGMRPGRTLPVLPLYMITIEETFRFPATFYDPARMAVFAPAFAQWNDQGNLLIARGNSPNQNSWLLEGVPIVNPNHTPNAGTFSDQTTLSGGGVNILSAQMLGTSLFFTGNPPVAQGDATGALLDMTLRKGNDQHAEGTFQLSLIGIDLSGEGPFGKKDTTAATGPSWLANYRYSTVGLLTALGMDFGGEAISFQDLALTAAFPGKRHQWKVWMLGGLSSNIFRAPEADSLRTEQKDRLDIDFRNRMYAIGFSHQVHLGAGWLWQSAVSHSALASQWQGSWADDGTPYGEEQLTQSWLSFRSSLHAPSLNGRRWSFGIDGKFLSEADDFFFAERQQSGNGRMQGWWVNPWVELEARPAPEWIATFGLRGHYFSWNGSKALDPRIQIRWQFTPHEVLYASWGFYSQLHHLRVYATATDGEGRLYNKSLPLLRSQQATLGWAHTFQQQGRLRTEAYWQYFFDLPVGNEAPWFSVLNMINEPATKALQAVGTATRYGIEVSWKQPLIRHLFYSGGLTRFRSLWTDAAGRQHPSRFDRKWGGSTAIGYERMRHKRDKAIFQMASLSWIGGGGMRETPIDAAASSLAAMTVWDSSRPFADRLPPYWRIDLRWSRRWEKAGRSSLLALDIQNLTNRRNVAWRYYDAVQGKVIEKYQLGLIPVLTWRLEY